jgi:hypothetical protein
MPCHTIRCDIQLQQGHITQWPVTSVMARLNATGPQCADAELQFSMPTSLEGGAGFGPLRSSQGKSR